MKKQLEMLKDAVEELESIVALEGPFYIYLDNNGDYVKKEVTRKELFQHHYASIVQNLSEEVVG